MDKTKKFISKWDRKKLEDWGSTVSTEYNMFQNAFMKAMSDIAESLGGRLAKYSKGHYDMSGFIEKNGKYVYFCYSNYADRSRVKLTDDPNSFCCPMYVRTAKNEDDYHGGTNHDVPFSMCEDVIRKLLEQ